MADEEDLFAVFQTSTSETHDSSQTTKPKTPARASSKRFAGRGEDDGAAAKQAKVASSSGATAEAAVSSAPSTFEKLIGDDYFADTKDDAEGESSQLGFDEKDIPRMQIYRVDTNDAGCTHEVAVPPAMKFVPLAVVASGKAAKTYKFELDAFQKQAVMCIENSQSVLVSAHTSAGKTAIAEYAIALSLNSKQRVLYTTPIKALSNQKYRELADEFTDVGLMTGDVTINATASCLVMTTEILRSMLYRGSEVMREVAWVVFDEIHYMRDAERGVVWEESIILLPDNIHFVFLSATIPNARQFAEWIAHLHKQPCHVVYTDKRPVPLEHEVYSAGDRRRYLVLNAKGEFDSENFQRAMASLSEDTGDGFGEGQSGGRRRRPMGGKADLAIVDLIKDLHKTDQTPAIVFSFSRRDCERLATATNAEMRFTNKEEQKLITQVFENALDTLSEEDRQLESLVEIKPMLKRGIGVHHSGLLPLLKETIEILFSEGLIKVLFATETFSMGLNMPARTVLFASARKFDGKDYRFITSGEYIQMSGRAGRRGIDAKGTTIIVVDERMTPNVCTQIIKGQADALNSAFHLTYNMILNLMRVEDINPEYMLEKSFFQFQTYATLPDLIKKVQKVNEEYATMRIDRESELQSFHKLRSRLTTLREEARKFMRKPLYLLPFLQPGRLIRVADGSNDFSWGVVLDTKKKDPNAIASRKTEGEDESASAPPNADPYSVDCLLYVTKRSAKQKRVSAVQPCRFSDKLAGELQAIAINLSMVNDISSYRLALPSDLRETDSRKRVYFMLSELFSKLGGESKVPTLDWRNDLQIRDPQFLALLDRIDAVDAELRKHPLFNAPEQERLYQVYMMKMRKQEELGSLKRELQKKRSLIQMRELKNRKRVLRRLGYCNQSDVIEIKGRVACEISSADELVLTELLFNGVFSELSAAQCAAVLSCFVFQDKASEFPKLGEELIGPLRTLRETARRIARVSRDCKLELEEEQYVDSFRPHLMDVVFAWCNGASFRQVCSSTDVFEGSIVRTMRRLEETLRQTCYAAKAIGNTDLENKFADAVAKIKRDIIFAASLYL